MLQSNHLIGFGGRRASVATQSVTWNPSDKDSAITLSNGNLDAARATGSGWSSARATLGRSTGLFYFEVVCITGADGNTFLGIGNASTVLSASTIGQSAASAGLRRDLKQVSSWTQANSTTPGGSYAANDRWMFAVNLNNGKLWCGVNGTWTSGDPAADTTPWVTGITGTVYPMCSRFVTSGQLRLVPDSASMSYLPSGFSPWNLA